MRDICAQSSSLSSEYRRFLFTVLVADIYIRIFDGIISGNTAVGHGVDGYYNGLSDHFSWYEASKEIGRVLVKKGLHKSDEPTTFTEDELVKYFTSLVRTSCSHETQPVPHS